MRQLNIYWLVVDESIILIIVDGLALPDEINLTFLWNLLL